MAPYHDESNPDRLQPDIAVLLPSLPDEVDACVGRLVAELEGRKRRPKEPFVQVCQSCISQRWKSVGDHAIFPTLLY